MGWPANTFNTPIDSHYCEWFLCKCGPDVEEGVGGHGSSQSHHTMTLDSGMASLDFLASKPSKEAAKGEITQ